VAVPIVAVVAAVNVKTLVAVVGLELNAEATPLGKPEADSVTLSLNPFCGVIVIVTVVLVPCSILMLPVDAESVK
jgi:hypothetical protein